MARLVTLCLLLLPSLGEAQTPQGDAESLPLFLRNPQPAYLSTERTYDHLNQNNNRVGLFVVAAAGTLILMAAVYCIYNKFYSKQQYLHTQLQDHSENPPMMFPHCPREGDGRERPGGYGSLSATPSVISIPPSLSPSPGLSPFHPLYRSSHSLRTISARDLEKSFI
ncbi:hypothetical protein NHX12_025497 [Muraenolepis orangiensis]|uniref:Uncharacterized protein n=1 Tax=Muraenolepis orangiensis TaxID=630683 RepID=A0A9Q0EMV4_9TELE|nr:hypothetical protein NHX12_025497 [Muraenolepis orangiensis]